MRMRNLNSLLLLPQLLYAFKLPFLDLELELFGFGAADAVSSHVIPHKVAIIGAGAAGSSAAFWISKAKEHSGVLLDVDVYEREDYVGGRSTVVYPYNDTSLYPLELGASIFVKANKNLVRAAQHFQLNVTTLSEEGGVGIWDGQALRFSMSGSNGMYGWWDSLKALWRYGYSSPKKVQDLVDDLVKEYVSLYSNESPHWENISSIASELGFTELLAETAAEYLDLHDVLRKYSREVVEAATRVNYGQNLDEISGMGGAISMATNGAMGVTEGNYQIFSHFLKSSHAKFFPNTAVTSISKLPNNTWALYTNSDTPVALYNDVIIAAPFHSTGIRVKPAGLASSVPKQPYVHLHVTLLSTTSAQPNSTYFGLAPGSSVPTMMLTTYEGAREGGVEPEFNSLSYHGPISANRDEWTYKIFSKERLSDKWLNSMFNDQVGWVLRKEWDAYPVLRPTNKFASIKLDSGLYYVNAFEPLISTMETETVASRNVVDLLFKDRFGTGICGGKKSSAGPDVVSENPHQAVFEKLTPSTNDESFVLGFDC